MMKVFILLSFIACAGGVKITGGDLPTQETEENTRVWSPATTASAPGGASGLFTIGQDCKFTGAVEIQRVVAESTVERMALNECADKCARKAGCKYFQMSQNKATHLVQCSLQRDGGTAATTAAFSDAAKNIFCASKDAGNNNCENAKTFMDFQCDAGFQTDASKGSAVCTGSKCTTAECCSKCVKSFGKTYKQGDTCPLETCDVGYAVDTDSNTCVASRPSTNLLCPNGFKLQPNWNLGPMTCKGQNSLSDTGCVLGSSINAYTWCTSGAGIENGCCGVAEMQGEGSETLFAAGRCPGQTSTAGASSCVLEPKVCGGSKDCGDGYICKNGLCEFVTPDYADASIKKTDEDDVDLTSLDQYKVGYNCNFLNFNSIGSPKIFGGGTAKKWNRGSQRTCSLHCDNTAGCIAWVLSKDKTTCSTSKCTGDCSNSPDGFDKVVKNGFVCATRRKSYVAKCANHICPGAQKSLASASLPAECTSETDCSNCCQAVPKSKVKFSGNTGTENEDEITFCAMAAGVPLSCTQQYQPPAESGAKKVESFVTVGDYTVVAGVSKVYVYSGDGFGTDAVLEHTLMGHAGSTVSAIHAVDSSDTEGVVKVSLVSGDQAGKIMMCGNRFTSQDNPASCEELSDNAHDGKEVSALVASKDAPAKVLSAGKDFTVKLWDAGSKTGARIGTHQASIDCLTADFARNLALSGGHDKVLKLWSLNSATNTLARTIGRGNGHKSYVRTVSADFGKMMAVSGGGGNDPSVKVWDLSTGNLKNSFNAHTMTVKSVSVDFGTDIAVSAGLDKKLVWFNLRSGTVFKETTRTNHLWQVEFQGGKTKNYCLAWGCTCQGLANAYGVDMSVGMGKASALAISWFQEKRCAATHQPCTSNTAENDCPTAYCFKSGTGKNYEGCFATKQVPTTTAAPAPAPAAVAPSKGFSDWWAGIPVVGELLTMIHEALKQIPIVINIFDAINSIPQGAFESVEGKKRDNAHTVEVITTVMNGLGSFKQGEEGAEPETVTKSIKVAPEVAVFNKQQADMLIDNIKAAMSN